MLCVRWHSLVWSELIELWHSGTIPLPWRCFPWTFQWVIGFSISFILKHFKKRIDDNGTVLKAEVVASLTQPSSIKLSNFSFVNQRIWGGGENLRATSFPVSISRSYHSKWSAISLRIRWIQISKSWVELMRRTRSVHFCIFGIQDTK